MVTNAHHIPSIGPRIGEAGNSFALNTKSCENEIQKTNSFTHILIFS